MDPVSTAIFRGKYAVAIKAFECLLSQHEQVASVREHLLCSRAFCYQHLDLQRKALQDYDSALELNPASLIALVRKGKVLLALKRPKEAVQLWQRAYLAASPTSDIALLAEACALIRSLTEPSASSTEDPRQSSAAPLEAVRVSASAAATGDTEPQQGPQTNFKASVNGNGKLPGSNGTSAVTTSNNGVLPAAANKAEPDMAVMLLSPAVQAVANGPVQEAVAVAIEQINQGDLAAAHQLLDALLKRPLSLLPMKERLGIYLARGTSRAMLARDGQLLGAIEDFSAAIKIEPAYPDSWKRRAQANGGMKRFAEALADFRQCITLARQEPRTRAECYLECGAIYQSQRDYRRANADLHEASRLDPGNAEVWSQLGLSQMSQGDIADALRAFKEAIRLKPSLREAHVNMALAMKEIGMVAEAEASFLLAMRLKGQGASNTHLVRAMAELRRGCGRHADAIRLLEKAINSAPREAITELLFLRGACHHALGHFKAAVRDYETAWEGASSLAAEHRPLGGSGAAAQWLSFYQRELAFYSFAHLDQRMADFCLDRDLHPVMKENWCKGSPPSQEMLATYVGQRSIPAVIAQPPPPPPADQVATLVSAADAVGDMLKYTHQGFLSNVRMLRMGGLAAIELAQTIRDAVQHERAGVELRVTDDGASGRSGVSGSHPFGWRDAMDLLVKWRQLAEPNDQVVWVDLLSKAEFEAGFGSHTPIYTGQTKCVRYYMNFERALALMKEVLLGQGYVTSAVPLRGAKIKAAIRDAQSAEELWQVIGQDGWAVVPIASSAQAGVQLEGTRLTLTKVKDQPDAYELSIRTPVTPQRWKDFDRELGVMWRQVMEALLAGDKPLVAERAMMYTYYWYNFMPLARGTAAVGYLTLLSVFMAAEMPICTHIPKSYQTDWEALLSCSPAPFIASVSKWMYPPAAHAQGAAQNSGSSSPISPTAGQVAAESAPPQPPVDALPAVKELMPTLRARLEALNGCAAPRIHMR